MRINKFKKTKGINEVKFREHERLFQLRLVDCFEQKSEPIVKEKLLINALVLYKLPRKSPIDFLLH